jgi:hypothetical protein
VTASACPSSAGGAFLDLEKIWNPDASEQCLRGYWKLLTIKKYMCISRGPVIALWLAGIWSI